MVTTMMRCRSWWTQERSQVATIAAGTLPFRSLWSTVMGMASIHIEVWPSAKNVNVGHQTATIFEMISREEMEI